jgi:nucleotide-binding universal stress UspA family protein
VRRLLVGYDGSGPAREAARLAGNLAKGLGASVTVLAVVQVVPVAAAPTGMVVPVAEEQEFQPVVKDGARIVAALGVEVEARLALGDPADRILEVATREGYDLVVVGHRGMGRVADLVLGSVAKRVAEQAICPVLVVRGTAPDTIQRILVATDGSPHARTAVEAAARLAGAFGAEVTLLYVLDPKLLGAPADQEAKRDLWRALEHAGRKALGQAARICQKVGVAHKTMLAVGRPAETIVKRARAGECDLVAVGRRGLGGVTRLLVGSVSDEVLRSAGSPVLIVGARVKAKPGRQTVRGSVPLSSPSRSGGSGASCRCWPRAHLMTTGVPMEAQSQNHLESS